MVQLLHLYRTTKKKNIALTIRTFEVKVVSLFFNTLSRFVIAFLEGIHITISLSSTAEIKPHGNKNKWKMLTT